MKKAIVLLSGGLDSTTCLYWTLHKRYVPYCLIFDYNQRHKKEITRAVKIASIAKVPYHIVKFSLPWKGSSLLDKNLPVPISNFKFQISNNIPSTYVPARNTIFLSFAVSFAEAMGAEAIIIGANALDYSGYPDCRSGYYKTFNALVRAGTKAGVEGKAPKIVTPLINLTKAEIIKLGAKFKVPYKLTWSCYKGGKKPCGKCDSCLLRAKGFKEAHLPDPSLKGSSK